MSAVGGELQLRISVLYGKKFQVEAELAAMEKEANSGEPMFPAVSECIFNALSYELDSLDFSLYEAWEEVEFALAKNRSVIPTDPETELWVPAEECPF